MQMYLQKQVSPQLSHILKENHSVLDRMVWESVFGICVFLNTDLSSSSIGTNCVIKSF